ncbi:MAG: hypothetical protein H7X97_03585 [Opitutaceae bacterium]|nr:hypothetical protein [Verrucomicrobiales bacterium]
MKSSSRPAKSPPDQPKPMGPGPRVDLSLVRRHLAVGWWALLVFLTAGLVLEALHGFKIGAYLKVSNETRRLMWTLAHAHGTLLALVNLVFVATLRILPTWPPPTARLASSCLMAATVLMPAGFFLGGVFIYAGDPGLGILLVPVGGIFLFAAVLLTALGLKYFSNGPDSTDSDEPKN